MRGKPSKPLRERDTARVTVWPWPATKDYPVTLSPLPLLEWGEEWKEKGKKKSSWVGIRAV